MTDFFEHLMHEFELPLSNPILIFSLILSIILLSPLLLKKLNIPGIIGLIISGLVIGPYGLNILEQSSAVDLFSTIGLLYIMFIAGLELDMNQFKTYRNKSLFFGLMTFIFPLAIGYPVCFYLLGYDFNASFLTASMFATHTLIAYPIVSKLGVSKNQAVAITVGGTILTDTAVLIILAVIMGNSQGELDQSFWIRLGVSLAIFSAIMFFVIPKIATWFFRKMESEKHSHYIFVLAVVFFAAFLAEVAGVEPIIGAFMAGLTLNRLIPHTSALMNRIEFIGNSLFIPFFLISVGMLVDISVILSGPMALIIAGTLSVVALAGKWVAAFFTQLVFKYSSAQRQVIFGLSSAHAAATLAVILVGYRAGILDDNILNGTIILILITCIIASFATEKAGKQLVLNQEVEENEIQASNSIEHILLPIANFSNIEKLLEFVLLIKDKKSINPVSMLTIVPNNEEAEKNILKSKNKLEEYEKQASASEAKVNVMATIDHNASSGISRTAKEIMANIIVIGWPQRTGVLDRLIGKNVESIVNNADKNIFICSFNAPLVTHKRIILITPPLVEKEIGYETWLNKITKLATELSIPIVHYGQANTQASMKEYIKKNKIDSKVEYHEFTDWDGFLILSRDIEDNDMLILISSRKGSLSHIGFLQSVPSKLEKYFGKMNKIIVYPQQSNQYFNTESYEDISADPLNKGIDALGKIGKGIGGIFNR